MTKIIVLFNLKSDASIQDYEEWARSKDIPTVRSLSSVQKFDVLKTNGILGSAASAPYQYCELIEVPDMEAFFKDLGREDVQAGAKAFGEFADNPIFMLANDL
jgi:hypothetical protein